MIGCRPLTPQEITLITDNLPSERDRLLFQIGCYTGYRIQELLSIRVSQVWNGNNILPRLVVKRGHMKGKHESRSVILNPKIHDSLKDYILNNSLTMDSLLFPISRVQAWRILDTTVSKLEARGLFQRNGTVATHSMRKTFADKVYRNSKKDLVITSKALGHKVINNTVIYLSFLTEDVDNAILGE